MSLPRSHRFSLRKCKGLEKTVLLFSKRKDPGDDIYWAVNRLNFRSEMNWFRKSNSQNIYEIQFLLHSYSIV